MKEIAKISKPYLSEFVKEQTLLMRIRVRLFCKLAVGICFLATFLSFIVISRTFNPEELFLWGFLVIIAFLVFYLIGKAQTMKVVKFYAYLFDTLFLIILTKAIIIYPESTRFSAIIYIMVLFLVSLTMPWKPVDIVPILFLHIYAYTFLFSYTQEHMPAFIKSNFSTPSYFVGFILILSAFVICLVIRKKELTRDIENFILLKEVENKNEQMQRELELATRIHKTLIPKSVSTDRVDIAVTYLPAYYMGGDYAKFHFVDKDKLIFIIWDITGHGVSAALLVNRLHAEFESLAREGKQPGILLKELNDFIIRDFVGINMYLSAFCGLLNFNKMEFLYSNYGHPAQYIYGIKKSQVQPLSSQASLLGLPIRDDNIYQNEISFTGGDKILLFTDGLIEAKNKDNAEYGAGRLEGFIRENSNLPVSKFNKKLLAELNIFKDGNFKDDIFIFNIQIK